VTSRLFRGDDLKIPEDLIPSYFEAPDKEQFLQNMLTSAATAQMMKNFDPTSAK
jgi:hypothetical protein